MFEQRETTAKLAPLIRLIHFILPAIGLFVHFLTRAACGPDLGVMIAGAVARASDAVGADSRGNATPIQEVSPRVATGGRFSGINDVYRPPTTGH